MNDAIRMQISAFVDGELPDAEADLLLRRMGQDAALRKQAAEFLEIGRAMRGEPGVPGVERLQERISAALDDRPMAADEVVPALPQGRSVRPLVGVAVAASVALLAIVGLQFSPGLGGPDNAEPANTVAEVAGDTAYVVPPRPVDDQLRQYVMSHGASASELGGNSMNTRLVTLRLSEEVLAEEEAEEEAKDDAADEQAADDETPKQP
jgi:negative regulator of sigma E activity